MSALPGAIVRTFISAANLSAKKYFIAEQDADGKAILADSAAAGDDVLGVILDGGSASGDPVSVVISGPAKLSAGGALNEGDRIKSDGSGEGVVTTTAGDEFIAIALEDAADGDILEVLVGRVGPYAVT